MACREIGRSLLPQALEQLLGRSIRFTLQPHHHLRPGSLERIRTRSPMARRLRPCAMRRAHLTLPPGVRETLQKAIEIGVAMWKQVNAFARGQCSKVVLDRPNLIEESERIECGENRSQPVFHRICDCI